MSVYKLGSSGPEVAGIQRALYGLGMYRGAIDGDYGGATIAAVRAFQHRQGLAIDGVVGPRTWAALMHSDIAAPAIASDSLARRCLALTGAFETGHAAPRCFSAIAGDFDGQLLSFGALQWNLGQGTLQELLGTLWASHPALMWSVFGPHADELVAALRGQPEDIEEFARSIQDARHRVQEPWKGYAVALGQTAECQALQVSMAANLFEQAQRMAAQYGLTTERGVALMFDIRVQNGSISAVVRARIDAASRALPVDLEPIERERRLLEIIARLRAQAARPQWVADVLARKLCIARGRGTVHGIDYDLDAQYGIGLRGAP